MLEKRNAHWSDDVVTAVIEIPRIEDEVKSSLFYNKMDYRGFQEDEQRRYDRMMMKQIQKMVRDVMAPQIQEAMDNGATPEELEAMMPQTTEEIFALLGSLPTPTLPAPPMALENEVIHKSAPKIGAIDELVEPPMPEETIISDDDIYAILGVDSGHDETTQLEEASGPLVGDGPKPESETKMLKDSSECDTGDTSPTSTDTSLGAEFPQAEAEDDSSSCSSESSSDCSLEDIADVETKIVIPEPTNLNVDMNSESSLSVEKDVASQPCVSIHRSPEGSIQDEINEMFGTSISSDIFVEDLLPKSPTKDTRKVGKCESSEDDGPSANDKSSSSDDDYQESSTRMQPRGSLPKKFRSGPINTRDSIEISKYKCADENKTPRSRVRVPTKEANDSQERDLAEIGTLTNARPPSNDEKIRKVGKTKPSSPEEQGMVVAKESNMPSTTEADPAVSPQIDFEQEVSGILSKTRRELLRGQVETTPGPTPPPPAVAIATPTEGKALATAPIEPESTPNTRESRKSGKKIPSIAESSTRPSPISGRKFPSTSTSTPGASSSTLTERQKRPSVVDGKGGHTSDLDKKDECEKKDGRRLSAPETTKTSDRDVGIDGETEEDHKIVFVNGKRLGHTPESSHLTRRKTSKQVKSRKDYEVHGGWGNPLDFGAAPTGPSKGRKSSGKTATAKA